METPIFPPLRGVTLLLGSGSPRRHELIRALGCPVVYAPLHDVDEKYPPTLPPEQVPEYLSRLKADAYRQELRPDEVLVTADTVVILDGEVIGKPSDEADARRMLGRLSGRTHTVVTGVTLTTAQSRRTFAAHTQVTFSHLSAQEIEFYVERFRPLDKAGAYGVQEWIGYIGVEHIDGSFYNIMGLPVARLYRELRAMLGI